MKKNLLNLTSPQKAIMSMEQFYPNTSMNTISGKITLHTNVNFSLLEKAIYTFVQNTSNIRYEFCMDNDVIMQYENDYTPFEIEHFHLNSQNTDDVCNKIANTCFPLFNSPLFYFATFENEDLTGGFFVCVHHLIADAWAMSMLISSIVSIYSRLSKNDFISLNDDFSYADFIKQENDYLQSSKFVQDENFWNDLFNENIFEDIHYNNTSLQFSCEANRSEFKLSKKLTSKITDFCKILKISPFTFMLFVIGFYESRIKQTNHIVLSTPILNRCGQKEKNTFGLFVNNMLYRLDIDDATSFSDAVTVLNKSQFSYLRHQKYPLQDLVANVKNKFQIKENIYDVSVSYQNARTNHCEDNVNYDSEWLFSGYSTIPLLFHIYDMDDTSSFSFIYDYQCKIYDALQIKDLHNRLLHICEQVIDNPDILIKDIELATQEEKYKILNDFNNTATPYDVNKTILDLWDEQVTLHPNKLAIICADNSISYKDLDVVANHLAAYLQKVYNVKKGNNISVILERSIDLIVATLAILKCGCSYVLIDSSHPKDRQEYMINNSNSQYVISDLDLDLKIGNLIVWNLNSTLDGNVKYSKPDVSSNDPMYLLYTSGSTGLPKAVTVSHRNFHNYLFGISQVIDYSDDKIVLSMASISFDVFGYELWVTLLHGLTLVLSSKDEQNDFSRLNDLILKNHISIIYGTPSKIQSLLSTNNGVNTFSSLVDIGIGGESFSLSFIKSLQQRK